MKTVDGKSRAYISFLRGFAVFCMVWGHCIQYCSNLGYDSFCANPVTKFIYSFHMPLFMLISGYLFFFSAEKRNFHDLMQHKIQSLIQPLVFCTIFRWLFEKIFHILRGTDSVQSILSSDWSTQFFSLWFIFSALLCGVWIGFVYKKVNNLLIRIVLFGFGFVFLMFFPNWDLNLYMYPYFVLGFIYAKYRNNGKFFKITNILKYIALPAFPIMLCFYDYRHYIYNTGIFPFYKDGDFTWEYSLIESAEIDAFRYLIGLAGSVFVIVVIKWIFDLLYNSNEKLVQPLVKVGNMSMQIYCISTILVGEISCGVLTSIGIIDVVSENAVVYGLLWCFVFALIWLIGNYWYIKLLYKLKIGNILFAR